jgi:hypothetical protein
MILVIPVSPEQEDVVADHLISGTEVGMVPNEREWMFFHAQKKHPGCRIISADLDVLEAEWRLTIEELP